MDIAEAVTAIRQGSSRSLMVKCPAHEDGQASLHVSAGTEQPVILRCHAGCETADIIAESGIDWNEVCKPLEAKWESAPVQRSEPIVYSYTDEDGTELFQALRFQLSNGKKDFRQRHRVGTEWVWNLREVRRVPYRLPSVVEAVKAGQIITVVEGEKDVHTAEGLGLVATCNPMGAGKWLPEYTEALRGATVHIVADADTPGRRHAREVAKSLRDAGCTVRTFETAMPRCKDLTDHVTAGGALDTLIETTLSPERFAYYGMDVADYARVTFAEDEFVIPDTLAYEERAIITGFEGHGKSTLLRQIAVQVAYGIHPWTLQPIPPKRVLVIDAENAPKQMQSNWQMLLGLAHRHSQHRPAQDEFFMIAAREEPDLTGTEGREWFMERMVAHRPDLLVIGPIQNLTARDVKDDEVVRKFKRTINEAREVCRSAIIMEHHCPHKAPGDQHRNVRPYGSSLFMKWPDYGYGMKPIDEDMEVYKWQPWRRPRVRTRQWPDLLRMGTPGSAEWPWMAEEDVSGSTTVRSLRS